MTITLLMAACSSGGPSAFGDRPLGGGLFGGGVKKDAVYAPGLDPRGEAVDGLEVGHRLMEAGQHELALEAFTRAAGKRGLTAEVLVALGSANLALGRLNQSEKLLRRSVKEEPDWPEGWNNLGVVLIERGKTAEAAEMFRRAYALDDGQSDSIRDNLRLALAKQENSLYGVELEQEYKLVRRGRGSFLIRPTSG
ncbi:tetratricopeptide repeat protein [Thalassococcus lentus]|uniref:Tetratricopeptide repeat protein n=1 Tax=Thalassococcus lentus TaxID=1210524 RepID=A0ABT4XUC8_9RHOB|nr:tetratricopeptide repeat protein [Thalassococcus lentus]MDA7425502.1 tetratricopeptide repeat protein [Thalassococcus lentus]